MQKGLIQVIHIKMDKKGGKINVFEKFSTLSTEKPRNSVDYSKEIKERMFCEVVMKI